MNKTEMIIYQTDDGKTKIDVRMENETVWLTQAQMAGLFQRDISVISRHIKNAYIEGEIEEESTLHFMQIPNSDKQVAHYNDDFIKMSGSELLQNAGKVSHLEATTNYQSRFEQVLIWKNLV